MGTQERTAPLQPTSGRLPWSLNADKLVEAQVRTDLWEPRIGQDRGLNIEEFMRMDKQTKSKQNHGSLKADNQAETVMTEISGIRQAGKQVSKQAHRWTPEGLKDRQTELRSRRQGIRQAPHFSW